MSQRRATRQATHAVDTRTAFLACMARYPTAPAGLEVFPFEVLNEIFSRVPPRERGRMAVVHPTWRALLHLPLLWGREVCLLDDPKVKLDDEAMREASGAFRTTAREALAGRYERLLSNVCRLSQGTLTALSVDVSRLRGHGWVQSLARLLGALPVCRHFRASSSDQHELSVDDAAAIFQAAPQLALCELDVFVAPGWDGTIGNELDKAAAMLHREAPFGPALQVRTLRVLSIVFGDTMDIAAHPSFVSALAGHTSIEKIVLNNCELRAAGSADGFADALLSAGVTTLTIESCPLDHDTALPMLSKLLGGGLRTVRLSGRSAVHVPFFDDAQAQHLPAFCQALKESSITTLDLTQSGLHNSPNTMAALLDACEGHPTLTELKLREQSMPQGFADAIASLVAKNGLLQKISLDVPLADDAASIFDALAGNTHLRELSCSGPVRFVFGYETSERLLTAVKASSLYSLRIEYSSAGMGLSRKARERVQALLDEAAGIATKRGMDAGLPGPPVGGPPRQETRRLRLRHGRLLSSELF